MMKKFEKFIFDIINFSHSLPIYVQVLATGMALNIIVASGKFWLGFLESGIIVFIVLFIFGLAGGIIIFAAHTVGIILVCPFRLLLFPYEEETFCSLDYSVTAIWFCTILATIFAYLAFDTTSSRSGVPPLYRLAAFFTRDRNALRDHVRRASSSDTASPFDISILKRRMDRKTTNRFDETLEREEIEKALREAEKAAAALSKRESELRQRQEEKLRTAELLAKTLEEVERLKARLHELEKGDKS
jgi:hypothetical protein